MARPISLNGNIIINPIPLKIEPIRLPVTYIIFDNSIHIPNVINITRIVICYHLLYLYFTIIFLYVNGRIFYNGLLTFYKSCSIVVDRKEENNEQRQSS